MTSEPLAVRATRAASWVVALQVAGRLLGLLRIVVLARLLAPRDFGLMGIALLVMTLVDGVTDLGIEPALIQRPGDIEEHLDTAWTLNLLRQLLLAVAVFACAPLAGSFFHAPRAPDVVRVLAGVVVIDGLRNMAVVYFERELAFSRIALIRVSASMADLVVTLALAVWLHSVWALVGGAVAASTADVVLSYVLRPRRPRLRLDRRRARELLQFGKWVFWGNAAVFVATNVDDIFVGRILGTTPLGYYQVAYRMGSAPTTEVAHVVNQVAFPAYSVLQGEAPRLRDAFLRTLRLVAALSFALAAAVTTMAAPFVISVLGTRWEPAIGAARLLGVYGGFRALGAVVSSLLWAVGRPELVFRLLLPEAIGMVVLLYPLVDRYGIEGAAAAMVVPALLARVGALRYARKVTDVTWGDLARALVPGAAGALAVALVGAVAVALLPSTLAALAVASGAAGGALLLVHLALHRVNPAWAVVDDVRSLLTNLRTRSAAE